MELEFELIPDLPRLAWAARLQKNDAVVRILHGPWVETRPNCFFEGAWDGPFGSHRFDQALTFAGSGARLADDGIVFAAPTHTFEMLYCVRRDQELFVSNSLAFVLALSGERLDPSHPHYYLDFLKHNRQGIRTKHKRLRLAGAKFAELYDCCNLAVRRDLTARRMEKQLGPPPADYSSYVSFLSRTVEDMFRNASDPGRRRTYRPVTTMSQGYDSTAVSALAAKAGCCEAVTFRKSNGKSGYEDDGGAQIAPYLGLRLTEYDREDYDRLPAPPEHEFYIEPNGVDRLQLLMEEQLVGSLFLSGRLGERFWAREPRIRWGLPGYAGHRDFELPTCFKIGGCAMVEFRLRIGFIHFPLACSGGLHAPAIKAITDSPEMKPWSIAESYDRPIARRIAEEAGVPRHLFGQVKRGGPRPKGPERRNWINRMIYRTWKITYWPPTRILILRVLGNRTHPLWRQGSFAVQRGVERTIEVYLAAISSGVAAGAH